MATKTLDVCVFNITNDDLANAIIGRHKAGVKVRVISDDDQMNGKGNDCERMAAAGVAVITDDNPKVHMHDKFCIVDSHILLTGSFNWTFQAGAHNQENIAIIDHPYYIEKYNAEFNKIWK